jgi:hypothetical protein
MMHYRKSLPSSDELKHTLKIGPKATKCRCFLCPIEVIEIEVEFQQLRLLDLFEGIGRYEFSSFEVKL